MSRLEKKCLLASTGVHALAALLLCAAPLIWVSQRHEVVTLPVLTIIPSRLVDGAMPGGGSPTATDEPAPAPSSPAPIQLAQPEAPKPAVREETKAPPKPRNTKSGEPVASSKKTTKPEEDSKGTASTKPRIELSFARDRESSKRSAESRRRAEASARAARSQYASKVNSVVGAIGAGISSGTSIEAPGPGGEATADYAQFVEWFYRQAWSQPAETDDLATVRATVVIRRDGTVESFRLTNNSGNAALDNSVQRLENLRTVAPFPEEARDERRTFHINFHLRPE